MIIFNVFIHLFILFFISNDTIYDLIYFYKIGQKINYFGKPKSARIRKDELFDFYFVARLLQTLLLTVTLSSSPAQAWLRLM